MNYYALKNVVYKEGQEVVCIVSPVWMLSGMAKWSANMIANALNTTEMDERDVLRGSLD